MWHRCWIGSFFLLTSAWLNSSAWLNGQDLVDALRLIPDLKLDVRYATANNFTKQQVYDSAKCFLRAEVAQQLAKVQTDLKKRGLGLLIYDCYRPLAVQRKFWAIVPDDRYVANPAQGSRHNRGAAVDLSLVDKNGKPLEMPTDFDDFSEKAHRDYSRVSRKARKHRQWLQDAMQKHGFVGLKTEWWHFDFGDWKRYPLLDIPIP
jgi:zinc D-Ala-D-Ala dipeptidase